jgi:Eco57I restriction-modification methylase/N-6 DNA Methylase
VRVRTLRSAAVLLANTTSVECAGPLLVELGLSDETVPLDNETRERLGVTPELELAHMALGPGSMRGLVANLTGDHSLRDTITRLAARFSSRTPHVLWVLVIIHRDLGQIAIACWYPGRAAPRAVALVASQQQVVDSDSETLCALCAAANDSDIATHARWLEILGRETVSRNFFRAMQGSVTQLAASLAPAVSLKPAAELAVLYLSRLVFLSFVETKGWLNGDHAFLANQFADCMVSGGRYHARVLAPLFFGTLNTRPAKRAQRSRAFGKVPFLNGGLFARSALERSHSGSVFADEALGDVFGQLLTRYRFTAREDGSVWSEAAVDPEMLGKTFESLMAAPDRKTTGAFYTPQTLVEQLTTSALASAIGARGIPAESIAGALGGELPSVDHREKILEASEQFRVLDPACGSGAFLVHFLERLAALRIHLGDPRPVHVVRREILTRSIFGVDVNPTAVWLCELRLWLSMAIENPERNPMRVAPLPNLDRNIRVGDSLAGGSFSASNGIPQSKRITLLRARYSRTVGRRKRIVARMLDQLERDCAVAALDRSIVGLTHERRELIVAARSPDLFGERRRAIPLVARRLADLRASCRSAQVARRVLLRGGALPFSFDTQFADVGAAGGFDIVIGNPPWVRLHHVGQQAKDLFAREFIVFRESAWLAGAQAAAAGRGFAAQVDLSALFIERSIALARVGGTVALLVPAKLWKSLSGGGVRTHLLQQAEIAELHDMTESRQLFDAAVYPSVIVARRKLRPSRPTSLDLALTEETLSDATLSDETCQEQRSRTGIAVVHRRTSAVHWPLDSKRLSFDTSPGSPWLIMPPPVREAFDRLIHIGIPLSETRIGRPMLGVKTGCNEAFVVTPESNSAGVGSDELTIVRSSEAAAPVERRLLKPLHRGESIRPWKLSDSPEQIIWTHDDRGPVPRLPPNAFHWLARWKRHLQARSDAHGNAPWWTIFRTESAGCALPRVAWSDFGRCPRAAVIEANDPTVLLNSCYVVRCNDIADAWTLAALLNSPVVAAWLNALAEPARGGYRRYLGWTVSLLPLPADWAAARERLAPLAEQAVNGRPPDADTLLRTVLGAYGLRECEIEPLLLWNFP